MTIADWLMIAAVLIGPIVAVQLTRHLDDRNEVRNRKLGIFKNLMGTRSYITSWTHVEALNRIDLEFSNKILKEKDVLDAWKAYLDLLNNANSMPLEQWTTKRIDLFVELLHKMALVLEYDFDKTHIKNSSYAPKAHGDLESQQNLIRQMAIELLNGKRPLPVTAYNTPQQGDAHVTKQT